MRRYIVLLLITGIVWAQTDFDKLVLKNGTTYLGEYSKIEGDRLYFKHQDALAFQPVPVKSIRNLQSKDGQIIIDGGKVKISLTLEEYQKLSTKEKAIYDARNNEVNEQFSYPKSLANEYDRLYYKQIYSNIRSERQGGNVLCCVVFTCLLVSVWISGLKFNYGGGLWEPSSNI
jgi:hypothetical protein